MEVDSECLQYLMDHKQALRLYPNTDATYIFNQYHKIVE